MFIRKSLMCSLHYDYSVIKIKLHCRSVNGIMVLDVQLIVLNTFNGD